PLVVARTGGLADLVGAGIAAGSFLPGDAVELAAAVSSVLEDRDSAERSAERAARAVRRRYTWPAIARQTSAVYADALVRAARGGPS
ncbi:MAG: glycogen synthase, partial [Pseudonocardiales bacterium]|nr:glycogen synthase [Pseudonocardiales bacterium]